MKKDLSKILASGSPSGQDMQVVAPPQEAPMEDLMPDAGVPAQPFQIREALPIRPHYLGHEKRYPLTSRIVAAQGELISKDLLKKALREEFGRGIEQYRRSGEYIVPVAEFAAMEVVDHTHPGDFYASDDQLRMRQEYGPDERWVDADDYHLLDAASEGLDELLPEVRKELAQEFSADLEIERNGSDFILFLIFSPEEMEDAKKFAGVTQTVYDEPALEWEAQNLERLKLSAPKEFWPSYEGQVRQLAEEHGIGDVLGFSFRPDCIEIVGVDKIMELDYDMKHLQSRELYPTQGEL